MLHTNRKEVINDFKKHILYYYTLEEFQQQVKSLNYVGTPAQRIDYMVQGGCFLCYYSDVREFLKDTLQQTQEEAEQYTNEQVWNKYKNLVCRAGLQLLNA